MHWWDGMQCDRGGGGVTCLLEVVVVVGDIVGETLMDRQDRPNLINKATSNHSQQDSE